MFILKSVSETFETKYIDRILTQYIDQVNTSIFTNATLFGSDFITAM